jgi:hypothetical protein
MANAEAILEFNIQAMSMLTKEAEFKVSDLILEVKGVKHKISVDQNEKLKFDYMKFLLNDFIREDIYYKSCNINYIYLKINEEKTYVCYDSISVNGNASTNATITPASFIKLKGSLFNELKTYKRKRNILKHSWDKFQQDLNSNEKYLEKCGHVQINAFFTKIEKDKDDYSFTIHQKIKIFRYPWGEHLLLLPVPNFPEPGEPPEHGQLLGIRKFNGEGPKKDQPVIWDNVWKSLEDLNTVLRTPGKKKVFIKGEPGSGKEVFANAIHYGAVLSIPDRLIVRSVAGAGSKDLRIMLFGQEIDGVNIPGLIEKAEGGTLFLDEFDKILKEKFYPELLRVLEAGEYIPVNGKNIQKVGDVNWIFAGAFMGTGISKPITDLPQDFWSRLTSLIEIKNPIVLDQQTDKTDKYSYAGVMFLYFFMQEVAKYGQGVERITNDKGDFRSSIARLFTDSIKQDALFTINKELLDILMIEFQDKINSGNYFRSGKLKNTDTQDDPCPEQETIYWSNRKSEETPCKAYDSVRSIRQAAIVASAKCFTTALESSEIKDCISKLKESALKESANEAAKTVWIARPGNHLP